MSLFCVFIVQRRRTFHIVYGVYILNWSLMVISEILNNIVGLICLYPAPAELQRPVDRRDKTVFFTTWTTEVAN